MIQLSTALAAGNAVSLLLRVDGDVDEWRLLRRRDAAFAGWDDAGAVLVEHGDEGQAAIVDFDDLENDAAYVYRLYVRRGPEWAVDGEDEVVTPAFHPSPPMHSPLVEGFVRLRLALGLKAELTAGRLRHPHGVLPVLATYPTSESLGLPLVTVMLERRAAEVRGIGEVIAQDVYEGGSWLAFEGWLDRSTVQIAVWALGHEDRLEVRNAVQRVLMSNLPVFEAAGLQRVDWDEAEAFDGERFSAPVFQSVFRLNAIHPAVVEQPLPAISDVEVKVDAY